MNGIEGSAVRTPAMPVFYVKNRTVVDLACRQVAMREWFSSERRESRRERRSSRRLQVPRARACPVSVRPLARQVLGHGVKSRWIVVLAASGLARQRRAIAQVGNPSET